LPLPFFRNKFKDCIKTGEAKTGRGCQDFGDEPRSFCLRFPCQKGEVQARQISGLWGRAEIVWFAFSLPEGRSASEAMLKKGRVEITLKVCRQLVDLFPCTGTGCQDTIGYLKKYRPNLFIIENVSTLCHGEEGKRDVDFIEAECKKLNYWVHWFVVESSEYGSPALRERLYMILAFNKCDDGNIVSVFADEMMGCMKLNQLAITDGFIIQNAAGRKDFLDTVGLLESFNNFDNTKEKDKEWKDEHNTFYRYHGLTWPLDPRLAAFIEQTGLNRRQFEAAYLYNQVHGFRNWLLQIFPPRVWPSRNLIELLCLGQVPCAVVSFT
jgi:hypothetical protein